MGIIDIHTHVGRWMFPLHAESMEDLLVMERAAGIDVCIASSASAIVYDFQEGNALLAADLERSRGCLGYVVVNPHYLDESLSELETYRNHPRFVGMKLHCDQQAFSLDEPSVVRLVERAAEMRWPLLVHTFSLTTAAQLRVLARGVPEIPFIMAHMGGAQWRQALAHVADTPNIYLDPCSSYSDAGKIETAVALAGPGRVVFGSDATLFNPWFVRGMVDSAVLDEDVRRRIYWDNAHVIFGDRLDV